ncbi:MAG: hypothetical protein H7A51_02615 [Akkermansiaceae bacterium]|nr:hypothetical protein [Akkermansiaceae bacterium]
MDLTDTQKQALRITNDVAAGKLEPAAAIAALIKLGTHPDHAREMVHVATGHSDLHVED